VVGTGTHLGGVVAKARAKVKHTNARAEPSTDPTNPRQLLGWTKQAKMMAPSASVGRKVAVDATRVTEEVSPAKMSILLLYMYTYRQIH
jgi:hypothetical protein